MILVHKRTDGMRIPPCKRPRHACRYVPYGVEGRIDLFLFPLDEAGDMVSHGKVGRGDHAGVRNDYVDIELRNPLRADGVAVPLYVVESPHA